MSEKIPGVIDGIESYTGKDLAKIARETYGSVDSISPEQLALLMDYLVPSSYLIRNHRIKNGKQKFTFSVPNYGDNVASKAFSHRPWQRQIVNDIHPNVAVIKSRQLGLSEIGVAFMMWWADVHSYAGVNCLYTFPTYKQMNDFVKMRLNPILSSVPYYANIIDPNMNSIDSKKIRNSFLTFRTSSKPGSVEGINADFVSLDEYDRVPAQSVQSAENSMSSSNFHIFRRWSTPTAPNIGIHDLFVHSDQMEYMHKCAHCGYWNLMSYDDYIEGSPDKGGNILLMNPDGIDPKGRTVQPGTFQYVCRKCGKPLDRWYNGSWVQQYPSRTQGMTGTRGYHISQLNAVWVSADKLKADEMNAKSKQSFYNYNLGMPYADIKLQVTASDVKDNGRFTDRIRDRSDYQLITAGIDWGVKHTVVIMGMKNDGSLDVINQFQIDSIAATATVGVGSDIEALRVNLMPYDPDVIIADVGDSGERISRLIEIFGKDKVFGCKYSSDPTSGLYSATGKVAPTWNENANLVTVDKLVEHKRFIDMMKRGQFGFWRREDENLLQYIDHWENVIIRDEEQLNGDMRQVITRKAGDHSASASVYCLIGMDYLRDKFFGEDSYDFDYAAVDERLKPEDTDLLKQLKSSGNIYE